MNLLHHSTPSTTASALKIQNNNNNKSSPSWNKPAPRTRPSSPSSEDDDPVLLSSASKTTSAATAPVPPSSTFAGVGDDVLSDDDIDLPQTQQTRGDNNIQNADHQRQQYALPPVDYTADPGPLVRPLRFVAPDHLDTDPIVVAKQTDAMRATVRNGHSKGKRRNSVNNVNVDAVPIATPIISCFRDTSPPVPAKLIDKLSSKFSSPTPIQSLTFPYALAGRDLVAIAQTGSGKTLAYALPLLAHVALQAGTSRSGQGPVGLVLVPTRDLATQITDVLNDYGAETAVSSCCVVGGVGKYEQFKQIRDSGMGIIVSTPGRLIDMLRMRACRMRRCSFVVIDEADRMFDLGFGPQVGIVLSQIRPDAQLALYSATMPKVVERLVSNFLKDPVHISFTGARYRHEHEHHRHHHSVTMVSDNVTDCFLEFDNDQARQSWLLQQVPNLVNEGLLIIFCATRGDAAALANVIRGSTGMPTACVHGETDQADRQELLRMFRANELPILVTTDVAARGLDIADVQNVINYGCAKSWEWHVHRVGRCGRASKKGSAFTLMNPKCATDLTFANEACTVLRREKRPLPAALVRLQELARKSKDNQKRGRYKRNRN